MSFDDLSEIEKMILSIIYESEDKKILKDELEENLRREAEVQYSYSTPKFKGFGSYRVMLPGKNRPRISWDDFSNYSEYIDNLISLRLVSSESIEGNIIYHLTAEGQKMISNYSEL